MSRNVEIKAKVLDIKKLIEKVKTLTNTEGEILEQTDTFFRVPDGRLKLRNFEDSSKSSQLIFYNRPDTEGPKLSSYSLVTVNNPQELTSLLSLALGTKGIVKKKRLLFLYGQTRIHIDQVEQLGNFLEFEVVLRPDQTTEEGQTIANDLMEKLDIGNNDLIKGAYLDHLNIH